jgi:phosphatidylinositol alpha-1,6-mannosyltransferase
MRLLLLSIEFPPGPGGLGTLAYQIARHLTETGWGVMVSTPQHHAGMSAIKRFNAAQPFAVQRLRPLQPAAWEGLYRLGKALQIIRRSHPDVVLAVGKQAVWLGAMLSLITRMPLVAIGGGSEFLGNSRMERRLTRWAFRRAACVIAISHYTRKLITAMGINPYKVKVVPCGADAHLYHPGLPIGPLRERLGLGEAKVILTVGQLSERKAQDVVIRALPQVIQACPDVAYLLVGLPTRRQELEQLAKDLGVDERVLFTGCVPLEQLPFYYNLAEVFVLVSRRTARGEVEGFGIVVAEAALCGAPAVVSRDCGLEEAVVENETALVVNPDDPEATAEAIAHLLLDDALRLRMGQAANRYATQNATWKKRVREYDAILRNLVAGGDPCAYS